MPMRPLRAAKAASASKTSREDAKPLWHETRNRCKDLKIEDLIELGFRDLEEDLEDQDE